MFSIRFLKHAALAALLALSATTPAAAQSDEETYGKGLSFNLGEGEQLKLRFMNWNQIWMRGMQNNPGTIVKSSTDEWSADIMLRRARVLILAELSDRVLLLTHFGINNQTFSGGGAGTDAFRPQVYIHDAVGEVAVVPEQLYIGAGLNYWNGVSRMTNASTISLLGLDAPILNWATIDRTDQFARQLGVYAKGELGQAHYRVALARPFVRDMPAFVTPEDSLEVSTFNANANSFALKGYFDYAFFEKESHKLPYYTGTYLGTKKVFNLGAGFDWHPNSMVHCSAPTPGSPCPEGAQNVTDLFLFGADAFLDLPWGNNAVTSYLAYYYQDFGPDMQRTFGVANLASNGPHFGNAYPNIGTGHHVYGQFAYLFPFRMSGGKKLSAYGTLQASMLDQKEDPSIIRELGAKLYMIGHHSSLTFNWRNRPVFIEQLADDSYANSTTSEGRANELIMQLQVWL